MISEGKVFFTVLYKKMVQKNEYRTSFLLRMTFSMTKNTKKILTNWVICSIIRLFS